MSNIAALICNQLFIFIINCTYLRIHFTHKHPKQFGKFCLSILTIAANSIYLFFVRPDTIVGYLEYISILLNTVFIIKEIINFLISCHKDDGSLTLHIDGLDSGTKTVKINNRNEWFKQNFEIAKEEAKHGDVVSMVNLALYYLHGTGTNIDLRKAKYWAEAAIKTGSEFGIQEGTDTLRTIEKMIEEDNAALKDEIIDALNSAVDNAQNS